MAPVKGHVRLAAWLEDLVDATAAGDRYLRGPFRSFSVGIGELPITGLPQ